MQPDANQVNEIRVRVTGYAPQSTEALVHLEFVDSTRRIGRAWGSFGMFLALAIVSVLIPVAHFLLVPGFLIAAFASLAMKLGATTRILSARGTCPDCAVEQDLDLPGAWRLPRDITCRGCQRRLTLTAAATPPPD